MFFFCFFEQKTAYEMRMSDWSSDVCAADLNGVVERLNKTLKEGLRRSLANEFEVAKKVQEAVAAYNTAVHSSTGYSPFFMVYHRDMVMPFNSIQIGRASCRERVCQYV